MSEEYKLPPDFKFYMATQPQEIPDDFVELVKAKQEYLEKRMADIYGASVWSHGTDVSLSYYKRPSRLKSAWQWLRWRIEGTWNVWRYGECQECARSDD